MSAPTQRYRPDIDGLRALAIIPVVGFHAFPEWIPGGYVGVDVFFVISGYLISLIILERLERGVFSFAEFYARRIRRLFPALVLVLVASLAWGWFRLYAGDYAQLGKHTAAGAGFIANLVFWGESGYFDTVAEAKPLLHLWSLGIEEQFYLLWPALLYATWRARLSPFAVMALLCAGSFLFNVVQVRTDEVATFYSPLTRLWELLLGGTLAYCVLRAPQPSAANALLHRVWRGYTPALRETTAVAGLIGIIVPVFLFTADTSFPGWRAGFPALGALLLIASGPGASVNRRVLSAEPLVLIGLISYPLYLWHWPFLSFATLAAGPPSPQVRFALVGLSVAASWLTYALLERPVRFVWRGPRPIAALSSLLAVAGVAGYVAYAAEGFHDRPINRSDKAHFLQYYERVRTRDLGEAYRAECDFMDWTTERTKMSIDDDCTAPGDRGTVFLWGDSHAQALAYGIRTRLPSGFRLAQVTTSACPPRLAEAEPAALEGRCARANAFALERIAATRPVLVVLAQIFAHQQTDWAAIARHVRQRGAARVLLVGPAPQWMPNLPLIIATNYWGSSFERVSRGLNADLFEVDQILHRRYGESDELEYVSLLQALCNDAGCLAVAPQTDQQLMTADASHLTPAGSIHVGRSVLAPYLPSE
jgi:peptidoglycan/LPS O-acetylase OafA/YrhL